MKKSTKILTLMVFAVLIIGVLAISVFATNPPAETPQGDIEVTDAEGVKTYLKLNEANGRLKLVNAIKGNATDIETGAVYKFKNGSTIKILKDNVDLEAENIYFNPKRGNDKLTIDLNGKAVSVLCPNFQAEAGQTALTIKNGTLNYADVAYASGKSGRLTVANNVDKTFVLTFDGVTVNMPEKATNANALLDMYAGKVVIKNSTFNFHATNGGIQAMAVNYNPQIELVNSTFNNDGVAIPFINAIRKNANTNDGNIVMNNVTVAGNFGNIVRFQNKSHNVPLACNATIDKNCKITNDGSNPAFHMPGSCKYKPMFTVTIENGAKLKNQKLINTGLESFIDITLGDGKSLLTKTNANADYPFEVTLPKSYDVEITDINGVVKKYELAKNADGARLFGTLLKDKTKVSNGCTIKVLTPGKLLQDQNVYVESASSRNNDNIVIDLNGNTLTYTGKITLQNQNTGFTLKNGTVESTVVQPLFFVTLNKVQEEININLINITVKDGFQKLFRVENQLADNKVKINILIDKDCEINTDPANGMFDPRFKTPGTTPVPLNITVENGAKFSHTKTTYDDYRADYVIINGSTDRPLFVPSSDNVYRYRILPKLTDGEIYVNIDSDINLIYVIPFPALAEGVVPSATFTIETAKGLITEKVKGVSVGNGRYSFRLEKIDPRYFGDTISILVDPDAEGPILANNTSIKAYLQEVINRYNTNVELVKLASDILYYGASAQKYTDYKTTELVTAGVTGLTEQTNVKIENSIFESTVSNADYKILSAALRLEGELNMQVRISAKDTAKLALRVTINGNERTIALDGATQLPDGTYICSFTVNAYEFADAITMELVNDTAVVGKVIYSVNSYIFETFNNAKEQNLLQALANYGASASNYKKK